MTTPNLKVKVQRRPTLKLKVLPRFPSNVTAASPILLDRTGGNYAFSLNTNLLPTPPVVAEFVFNVANYASPQAAINAAVAALGGVVYFPAGTWNLGSGSVGVNLNGSTTIPIRLTGPAGTNGGASQSVLLTYSGTGAMISAPASVGLEVDHLVLVASGAGTKVFDLTNHGELANIHDNSIFCTTSNAGNVGFDLDNTEEIVIERNEIAIKGGIAIRGINSAGHFAVKNIIRANIFPDGQNDTIIKGAGDTWTVEGNSMGAPVTTALAVFAATPPTTLNWLNNWMGDDTAGITWIHSNAAVFNSQGNTYGSSGAGTGINQTANTGTVISTGDTFAIATGVNINTGNGLGFFGPSAVSPPVVVGTPGASKASALFYSPAAVGTATLVAPFTIASTGNGAAANALAIIASDYATNGGFLFVNKDSGLSSAVHIFAGDNGAVCPFNFDGGILQIGGTVGASRIGGHLLLHGATSGDITIVPPAVAGTGTLTVPVATDTLIGKATTDTLTNKTFDTAGAGNSLSINGVAATANTGTGSVVRATSPSIATPTLTGLVTASGGQIAFPAVQVPSADPNTLDDYEEGTWTPVLTFATPGNLSVAYSLQDARYTKVGNTVFCNFVIVTSTFTFTTASGNLLITGLPFTIVNSANYRMYAPAIYSGITKAGYTSVINVGLPNTTQLQVFASGSGVSTTNVTAADTPTGGTFVLGGEFHFNI